MTDAERTPKAHGKLGGLRASWSRLGLSAKCQKALTAALESPYGLVVVSAQTDEICQWRAWQLWSTLPPLLSQEQGGYLVLVTGPQAASEGAGASRHASPNWLTLKADPQTGCDHATAVRAVLRQGIDSLAVEGLPNGPLMGLLVQAALTGHLVVVMTCQPKHDTVPGTDDDLPCDLVGGDALTTLTGLRARAAEVGDPLEALASAMLAVVSAVKPPPAKPPERDRLAASPSRTRGLPRQWAWDVLTVTPSLREGFCERLSVEELARLREDSQI